MKMNRTNSVLSLCMLFVSCGLIAQPRIGIVMSRYNQELVTPLLEITLIRFAEMGVYLASQDIIVVPGATEIPLVAARMASSGQYDAVLGLGSIIHKDPRVSFFAGSQVNYACQKISLDYNIPVICGVLVTTSFEQAYAHYAEHALCCADTTLEMVQVMDFVNFQVDDEEDVNADADTDTDAVVDTDANAFDDADVYVDAQAEGAQDVFADTDAVVDTDADAFDDADVYIDAQAEGAQNMIADTYAVGDTSADAFDDVQENVFDDADESF